MSSADGSKGIIRRLFSAAKQSAEKNTSMAGSQWRPPRSCDVYCSELKHCKSLRNRFHEYYTYGRAPDCQQWKQDFQNCKEWEKNHSTQAKESLQESERKRLADQRKFTPVWELRQNPPSDWHLPLNQGKPQDP